MEQRKRLKLTPPKVPRKIYLVRHAERIDLTYGYNEWIPMCFPNGKYHRADLNLPRTVPRRRTGQQGFRHDTPLTQVGLFQAKLTGEAFKDLGLSISYVYSSPALRCIQTCDAILKGMGCHGMPINIEPGLFEFLFWYKETQMPDWMNTLELRENGYNICRDYDEVKRRQDLNMKETLNDFYERNHYVMEVLIDRLEERPGDILVIGHSATLEACSRQLVGYYPRTYEQMFSLIQDIPYCAVVTIHQTLIPTMEVIEEEVEDKEQQGPSCYQAPNPPNYTGEWAFTTNNFPNFSHSKRDRFNWQILISKELLDSLMEKKDKPLEIEKKDQSPQIEKKDQPPQPSCSTSTKT